MVANYSYAKGLDETILQNINNQGGVGYSTEFGSIYPRKNNTTKPVILHPEKLLNSYISNMTTAFTARQEVKAMNKALDLVAKSSNEVYHTSHTGTKNSALVDAAVPKGLSISEELHKKQIEAYKLFKDEGYIPYVNEIVKGIKNTTAERLRAELSNSPLFSGEHFKIKIGKYNQLDVGKIGRNTMAMETAQFVGSIARTSAEAISNPVKGILGGAGNMGEDKY